MIPLRKYLLKVTEIQVSIMQSAIDVHENTLAIRNHCTCRYLIKYKMNRLFLILFTRILLFKSISFLLLFFCIINIYNIKKIFFTISISLVCNIIYVFVHYSIEIYICMLYINVFVCVMIYLFFC